MRNFMFKEAIKKRLMATYKTLLPFKWYISFFALMYVDLVFQTFYPSQKNFFMVEAYYGYLYRTPLYYSSMHLILIIVAFLFLLGTSNVRNHPWLARFIFLSPLYFVLLLF